MAKEVYTMCLMLLILFAALVLWLIWGNRSIQTSHVRICSPKLPSALDGLRVVHVSDLHNATFGRHNGALLTRIQRAQPDLIAITGDLINSYHPNLEAALSFAREAVKIAPCYFVTGNHEARIADYATLKQGLLAASVIVLENQAVCFSRGDTAIQIVGITDPAFLKSKNPKLRSYAIVSDALASLLAQENTPYTLLLAHRPDLLETYAGFGVDLVLSGHAHGGQFRLPFVGAVFAPNQGFFPKYAFGWHRMRDTQMVVSRGLGNSSFPVRVWNRPELVVVTLHHKNDVL